MNTIFRDIIKFDGNLIWLFNIGVEKYWRQEVFTVKDKKENFIVNHIEEILFMIAQKQDYIILRKRPDPFYLNTLQEYGLEIPQILCPSIENENLSISELILQDNELLLQLRKIGNEKETYLVPYAFSENEWKIAQKCQLKYWGGDLDVCKKINSKIYSRSLALECGFTVTEGTICNSFEEVIRAYQEYSLKNNPVVLKQPYGASGNGMFLINSQSSFKAAMRIVKRFYQNNPDTQWLVELWYSDKADYNYQVFLSAGGNAEMFSVKKQILNKAIYIGSIFSTYKEDFIHSSKLLEYSRIIGKEIYAEGYTGVLGIDAILLPGDQWIPIIEVNARFTLSTYLSFLRNYFPNRILLSFYHRFFAKLSYTDVIVKLKSSGISYNMQRGKGVLCYTAETINLSTSLGRGRAFFIVVGETENEVWAYYNMILNLMKSIS